MQAIDYLRYIVEQIHSTVFATVDAQGRPADGNDFLIAQDIAVPYGGYAVGHAVAAAHVAAVRNRNAQVVDTAS